MRLIKNDINSPLTDPTAPDSIDQHFNTSFELSGPLIDKNHCLMNAVKSMTILALLELDQEVESNIFISHQYPGVVIGTNGPIRSATIEARYLLWGLFLVIKSIMSQESVFSHWRSMIITLKRERQVVGYITFSKRPPPLNLLGNDQTIGLERASDGNTTNVAIDVAGNVSHGLKAYKLINTPDHSDISVDITGTGKSMTLDDVIMTIMNGPVYIASFPRDQTGLDPAKTGVTYRWAGESLSELAQIDKKAGKYSEVHLNVWLMGMPIGNGSVAMGTS